MDWIRIKLAYDGGDGGGIPATPLAVASATYWKGDRGVCPASKASTGDAFMAVLPLGRAAPSHQPDPAGRDSPPFTGGSPLRRVSTIEGTKPIAPKTPGRGEGSGR